MNQSAGYGNVYRTFSQPAHLQRPPTMPIGAPALGLLFLGLWSSPQYARYWPYVESQQRAPRVQIGDAPLPVSGITIPLAPYLRQPFPVVQRLPFLAEPVVVVEKVQPSPQAWNFALYYRDYGIAPPRAFAAVGDAPVPVRGTRFESAPYLRTAFPTIRRLPFLAEQPVVEEILPHPPKPWAYQLYYRDSRVEQRRVLSVGDAQLAVRGTHQEIAPYLRVPFHSPPGLRFLVSPPPVVEDTNLLGPKAWTYRLYYRDFPLVVVRSAFVPSVPGIAIVVEVVDQSGPRYVVVDQSGPRYSVVDQSASRFSVS